MQHTRKTDPQRLAALADYGRPDDEAGATFDEIAQVPAQICAAPIALVSLVADDHQWFKAMVGLP